jgi:hypothetical protein
MGDRAKIFRRREGLNAFRELQRELAHRANDPKGDPLIRAVARATRKWEKKKFFGLSAGGQNESL